MAKFISYSYGDFDGDDKYVALEREGDKVYRYTREYGHCPEREETTISIREYDAIKQPELPLNY